MKDTNIVLESYVGDKGLRLKQFFLLNLVLNIPFVLLILSVIYVPYSLYHQNYIPLIVVILVEIYTLSSYCRENYFLKGRCKKYQIQKWFNSYKIVTEEPLQDNKTCYPFMPHNILSLPSMICSMQHQNVFNGPQLSSRVIVILPFVGTLMKLSGFQTVNAQNFEKKMQKNKNFYFIPGGFEEATLSSNKEYRFLANRKGFIKKCLQYGYNIRPTIIFQENKGFYTTDFLMKFRLKLNQYKIPGTLFLSKYFLLPDRNLDLTVCIGKNIALPKMENPTKEDVEKYHQIFIKGVQSTFDNNVDKYDKGGKLVLYCDDKIKGF